MKIQSVVPFPLGPFDIIARDTAMKMIGQSFPAKDEFGDRIGNAKIIDVDWRSHNDVLLTIEMEV